MKTHYSRRNTLRTDQLRAAHIRRRHGLPEPVARLVAALHYGENGS